MGRGSLSLEPPSCRPGYWEIAGWSSPRSPCPLSRAWFCSSFNSGLVLPARSSLNAPDAYTRCGQHRLPLRRGGSHDPDRPQQGESPGADGRCCGSQNNLRYLHDGAGQLQAKPRQTQGGYGLGLVVADHRPFTVRLYSPGGRCGARMFRRLQTTRFTWLSCLSILHGIRASSLRKVPRTADTSPLAGAPMSVAGRPKIDPLFIAGPSRGR